MTNSHFSSNVKLEDIACPLGCPPSDKVVLTGRDRLHNLPGEYTVVKCCTCGLMRTSPRPTKESIGIYYPDDYGPYHSTKIANKAEQKTQHPLWKRLARKLLQFNVGRLPDLSQGRMLEIGCASGSFMHKMFLDGWDVEGIELSPLAAENARSLGYPVHTGSIETATPLKKPFDLIVGWMVIEHLYDPVRSLEELRNWIKPDGWLVISLPDAGSLEFRIFGNAWYALQLPAHLYHYTPETLRAVLLRSGWRIERIFYQRVLYNLFPSIGYVLSDMGIRNSLTEGLIKFSRQAGIVNFFLYPVSLLLGAMGQTGRITVWARRAND